MRMTMDPAPLPNATAHPTESGTHHGADSHARFVELLERHRGIVFKVAGSYCANADDRADLAQDITVQLWRAFPGYDGQRPFSTWMYRIALNVAISHLRQQAPRDRQAVPFDDALHDCADERVPDPETQARLRALQRAIAVLDPLNRALLLLYLDDCSQRGIADVLGLSESNVSTRIHRLKQRLRDEFAD